MKINKKGGFNNNIISYDVNNKLYNFISVIILGYFGCKILLGFFKIYPNNTSEKELYNFITTIIFSLLIFLYTNQYNREIFGNQFTTNYLFFIGYIIGLNLPSIIPNIANEEHNNTKTYKSITYSLIIFIILIISLLIYTGITNKLNDSMTIQPSIYNFILKIIIILIIIWGLIFTSKKSIIYDGDYNNPPSELGKRIIINCPDNKKRECYSGLKDCKDYSEIYCDKINDIYKKKSKGFTPNISLSIIFWILSLLFIYDSKSININKILLFLNGLVIGSFVSINSFYGISYILIDENEDYCTSYNECINKNYISNNKVKNIKNIFNNLNTLWWFISIIILILLLLIIAFYIKSL